MCVARWVPWRLCLPVPVVTLAKLQCVRVCEGLLKALLPFVDCLYPCWRHCLIVNIGRSGTAELKCCVAYPETNCVQMVAEGPEYLIFVILAFALPRSTSNRQCTFAFVFWVVVLILNESVARLKWLLYSFLNLLSLSHQWIALIAMNLSSNSYSTLPQLWCVSFCRPQGKLSLSWTCLSVFLVSMWIRPGHPPQSSVAR